MSQAGPSKTTSRPRKTSDLIGSSPEFGAFESAVPPTNTQAQGDLLSFDDHDDLHEFDPFASRRQKSAHDDLLDDIGFSDAESSRPAPIHVTLPPRPDEITPDYVPQPRTSRSPRRLSARLSFSGPGSPPRVSDAGRDIVFHPSALEHPHLPAPPSNAHRLHSETNGEKEIPRRPDPPSPAQSRLFNTLATTTKLASKWKSTIDSGLHPHPQPHARSQTHPPPTFHTADPSSEFGSLPPTALPIEVTHETPFANPEHLAGSYVPPSGAPGFIDEKVARKRGADDGDEWGGTKLVGRRENSDPVLLQTEADQLRRCLPARKRLSNQWTLLFSLDQHGASLSTLYRQVERFAATHRGSGNILIVRDGRGHRFGLFMNEAIIKREGNYYGSGECFMFKLDPAPEAAPRTFAWTGRNQYFALCEGGLISFGGGSGAYGLILDSTFSRNSSATCPTFDNEVLCSSETIRSERAVSFDCIGLEVWGT